MAQTVILVHRLPEPAVEPTPTLEAAPSEDAPQMSLVQIDWSLAGVSEISMYQMPIDLAYLISKAN
jgi:hypothetical protein